MNKKIIRHAKVYIEPLTKPVRTFSRTHPFSMFMIILGVLFVLILAGNILRAPDDVAKITEDEIVAVEVYRIGSVPRITTTAKVEKSGVITIAAQTSGVVNTIIVSPGQTIPSGTAVVRLTTNYQGGTAATVQRQLAGTNLQYQNDTLTLQKEIIAKNREIAEKNDANADELSNILHDSRGRTEEIITTSKSTLELIDTQITNAPTDDIKAQLLAQKVGLLNGLNAAESALRNIDYSSNQDKPARQLSDLQREITLKQLELQEKSLDLNVHIAGLNFKLAQITESLMYPATPFEGTIERVHVREGQQVTPGMPLVTISGAEQSSTIVALVSKDIASSIPMFEESYITIGDITLSVIPTHIAQEPTDTSLFAVIYGLSDYGNTQDTQKGGRVPSETQEAIASLTEGQYVDVSIPVGIAQSNAIFPFVPIDAIYQSQEESILFVVTDGVATSRSVVLGPVFGRYVEVREGLDPDDEVIVNRNVIEGDTVSISN